MKIYSLLLIGCLFLFAGCTKQECEPKIITNIETQTVYVPTKPKRPNIDCNFEGEGDEPIAKLLDCVVLQKKVIEEITKE